jgi:DNA-binding NarL/FixJ family response regulator
VPFPTAHRLIQGLRSEGLLVGDKRKPIELGPRLLRLVQGGSDQAWIRIAGQKMLDRVSAAVMETSYLAKLQLDQVVSAAWAAPADGGLLDAETAATIAFTRDAAAGSFEERDRRTLQTLMPHLQRAYQLRNRLNPDASRLGAGALNALSMAVIVVDGNMHVKHANAAAVALTNGDCGMTVSRTGPEPSLGNTILSARHRDDHSRLSQLVAAVAKGSSGCALRIRNTRDEPASQASLAILVSPAMTHFLSGPEAGCRIQPGTAMIVARHLSHSSLPHPGLMCDLYGLTKAEAAVALSFGGGATAEDVARMRRVSPETVRSQVKAILRKTNTSSLRDLERIIAISSAMLPAAL